MASSGVQTSPGAPRVGPAAYARQSTGSLFTALLRTWSSLIQSLPFRLLLAVLTLWLVGSVVVYLAEQGDEERLITSIPESLYWALVTMTTVGYGDYTPKTGLGRALAMMLMVSGMGVVALFTATIASIFVERRIREGRGLETIKVRNHVLLCGWNQYAERVLEGLFTAAPTLEVVLVNELPEATVNEILSRFGRRNLHYIRGDPAIEGTLDRANVQQAESAIVVGDTSHGQGMAADERTTLVTLTLRSMNPNLKVTAEVLDIKNEPHLRRAGAHDTVISGEFNGFLLSSAATAPGLSEVVRQLLSLTGYELRREAIPKDHVGRPFGDLARMLRQEKGFLILAMVTEKPGLRLDDLLTDDYSLVDQFIRTQFHEAGAEHLQSEAGGMVVTVNPSDSYIVDLYDTAIGIPRAL